MVGGPLVAAFLVWWAYSPGDINRDPFPERNPAGESLDVCEILDDEALNELLGRPADSDVKIRQWAVEDGAVAADLQIPAMYSRSCGIAWISDCDITSDLAGASPSRQVIAFIAAMADERRASVRLRWALDDARRDRDEVNVEASPEGSFAATYPDGKISVWFVEDRFVVNVSARPCFPDRAAVKPDQLAGLIKTPISDWVSN
jgi:hypothetical protein